MYESKSSNQKKKEKNWFSLVWLCVGRRVAYASVILHECMCVCACIECVLENVRCVWLYVFRGRNTQETWKPKEVCFIHKNSLCMLWTASIRARNDKSGKERETESKREKEREGVKTNQTKWTKWIEERTHAHIQTGDRTQTCIMLMRECKHIGKPNDKPNELNESNERTPWRIWQSFQFSKIDERGDSVRVCYSMKFVVCIVVLAKARGIFLHFDFEW